MNRKDGGKEGRTREGALIWSPEENFRERGQGGGRQDWGKEERGQGGARQGWRQGGTGAERRRFSEFFVVKREKKRDNCLISNKNH